MLASPEALAYLAKRGLEDRAAIDTFQLGFANRTLAYQLPPKTLKAGAAIRGRLQQLGVLRASGHEHFTGSLVVPIHDAAGQVVGLYGRKIRDDLRDGTPVHLYLPGAHRGVLNASALQVSREIILCEALLDALVLAQSDLATPLGVRDRALLEVLYSTGIRRLELIHLTLPDVDPRRGVCFVREGKGRKDRVVPIGQRALDWIERYLTTARPRLVVPPDDGVLFLTVRGRPLATNRLSELVHRYVAVAGFPTKGNCHVFRHTLATVLLQGGADVRHIQAILGHADLRTTARYTHVVIDELKAVHQRAHPAEQRPQPLSP